MAVEIFFQIFFFNNRQLFRRQYNVVEILYRMIYVARSRQLPKNQYFEIKLKSKNQNPEKNRNQISKSRKNRNQISKSRKKLRSNLKNQIRNKFQKSEKITNIKLKSKLKNKIEIKSRKNWNQLL